MAIVVHRLKRKTATGYDLYHLESQADLILRYNSDGTEQSGVKANVETSLTNLESDVSTLKSTVDGLVSSGGEPNKIDAITAGGTTVTITNKTAAIPAASTSAYGVVKVDSSLNASSANPVQNKAVKSALDSKLETSLKGATNGLAELDSNGKVPSSQLPSYVDDVLEGYLYNDKFYKESAHSTEITAESGKIYVDVPTNKTYRWSGSAYVEISASLVLGTGSNNAYYGDKGQTAYEHSQSTHARTDATNTAASSTNGNIKINGSDVTVYTHPTYDTKSAGLYKITVDGTGHISAASAVTKSDLTGIIGDFSSTEKGLVPSPGSSNTSKFLRGDGTWQTPTDNDTKNTAGATNTSNKIFLIGATAQDANPQTYTQDTAYVGTDGCVYSNGQRVLNIQEGTSEPTNQLTGDFWLEEIS